ncbi:MAG: hypothetical protein Ta2A_16650 [Treponemataceae bacterium]|nr:MAG: hypothetical protein Ta2A_16650 [Treponemataceae bacterium]
MNINIRVGIVGIISGLLAAFLSGFYIYPIFFSLFPALENNETAFSWATTIIVLIVFGLVYCVLFKISLIFWRKL